MIDTAADAIIAEISKNRRESVRVTLGEFKGHQLCGLRIWADDEEKGPVPTKHGFALKPNLLPALRKALADAETEARRRGWLIEERQAA